MIIKSPTIVTNTSSLHKHIIIAPLEPHGPAEMQLAVSLLVREFAFAATGDIGPFPADAFKKAGK